tara:strand:- start:22330 stop:24459 length:2130 start_codon:yes stop_codon:yes gene_type:complete
MIKNNKKIPALLVGKGLPKYDEIKHEDINKFIPILINELKANLSSLEEILDNKLKAKALLKWNEVIKPINEIEDRLKWSWGLISHLNSVCNSSELREAYSNQQPEVIKFGNKFSQSEIIYNSLLKLNNDDDSLDKTQKRILKKELNAMKHSGVGLNSSEKEIFNSITQKLAELSNNFSNNVLDSTNNWSLLLTTKEEVEGLPTRILETFSTAAKAAGQKASDGKSDPTPEKGPWRIGLDMPSYIPFLTYAKKRSLRETAYKAYVSRASEGLLNNKEIIEQILSLRREQAQILGYDNWADLSLESKMAKSTTEVEQLLEELRAAAIIVAQKELKELKAIAQRNGATEEANNLAPWDISYWSEKLRQEKYHLDKEALRPWFPLPQVLNGLFGLCEKLFDIKVVPSSKPNIPKWHKDVQMFDVFDKDGTELASFYLDPYSRSATKRGGAWMDECLTRKKDSNNKIVLPVAYLICNQTPPLENTPSLMSFEEVETLFHEFGHGLQHMLTKVDYPQAAGINNIEWDAVELPSQFMENWCLDRSTLMDMAKHWETGEQLAEDEFNKLRLSRTFNSGMSTLRQVHFALTDLKLHSEWDKSLGITPDELRRQIATSSTVLQPIKEDQFLCSFSHIFAGGYSAGYYSYKWAEVLSADAFSAFEEVGLEKTPLVKETGKRFRETVLSMGGSRPPQEIFKKFRGRSPSTKALIRHSGLTA